MINFSDPRTKRDAIKALRKDSSEWLEKIQTYVEGLPLAPIDRKRFQGLIGLRPTKGKIPASNILAVDELRRQLIRYVDKWQTQFSSDRFLFITLMDDAYRVKKADPILLLSSLKRKADKTFRALDLDGIALVEAGPTLNPPDTLAPEILFHVHGVFKVGPDYDIAEARVKLSAMKTWDITWGVPGTKLRHITEKRGRACFFAGYCAKHPTEATNVVEKDAGRLVLYKTTKGYRPDFALRTLEGLSHIPLQDLIFSVGDGKDLRTPIMQKVRQKVARAHPDLKAVSAFSKNRFWKRLWSLTKAEHDKSWFIM